MKKRLIDANALLENVQFRSPIDNKNAEVIAGCVDITRRLIENAPTVDAVEVVRCKDCDKISPSVTPIKDAVWCREFRAYMQCDGFCSYGGRKEERK